MGNLNKRPVPNNRTAKLIVTTARLAICHFKSAADKAKVLFSLTAAQRAIAATPPGLALLVRDKTVSERYVKRLLIKIGGMSRALPPREPPRKTPKIKLGKPFLTTDKGSVRLHEIVQTCPRAFRQPSNKAKNWQSTSLMEQVTGVVPTFTRSARGDEKAIADAEHRELVKATQDLRNVSDKFLTGTQRFVKSVMPPLPEAETVEAIKIRHALARAERERKREAAGAALT